MLVVLQGVDAMMTATVAMEAVAMTIVIVGEEMEDVIDMIVTGAGVLGAVTVTMIEVTEGVMTITDTSLPCA